MLEAPAGVGGTENAPLTRAGPVADQLTVGRCTLPAADGHVVERYGDLSTGDEATSAAHLGAGAAKEATPRCTHARAASTTPRVLSPVAGAAAANQASGADQMRCGRNEHEAVATERSGGNGTEQVRRERTPSLSRTGVITN